MRNYHRLTLAEREVVALHYHSGMSIRNISRRLGRSPSTISRELSRNRTGFYYVPVTANNKARRRCYRNPRKLVKDPHLRRAVLRGLRQEWSPAQISARLREQYPAKEFMRVCAETIYTY
ncbi:MAG: hypothetical protein A2W76_08865 [Gammaproteobacteria bacterium RIFCSPLOWO2_12_47_11]|nr:MAG: hypothetical protein A2W76_08865 [Gammaproteobacteria bacterium RIFCSPLOWO2_12_47_11]